MVYRNPPKGYFGQEYPAAHNVGYSGSLSMLSATLHTTMLPILTNDDNRNASAENVNPKNSGFAEIGNTHCSPDSIVPNLNVFLSLSMTKLAIETDKIRHIKVDYMPIYTAFENRLDAKDTDSNDTIKGILELTAVSASHEVHPNYNGGKLDNGSTAPNSDLGLTTTQVMEGITWDKERFFDALQYYDNGNMLKQVTGRLKTVTITRDRPFNTGLIGRNMPIVKTMNPYTFCGLLINVPQQNLVSFDQYGVADESTSALEHIHFECHIRFDEWNKDFDQSA